VLPCPAACDSLFALTSAVLTTDFPQMFLHKVHGLEYQEQENLQGFQTLMSRQGKLIVKQLCLCNGKVKTQMNKNAFLHGINRKCL